MGVDHDLERPGWSIRTLPELFIGLLPDKIATPLAERIYNREIRRQLGISNLVKTSDSSDNDSAAISLAQAIPSVLVAASVAGVNVKNKSALADPAQAAPGGIDMNQRHLSVEVVGSGVNMPLPKGFEWLATSPIKGFTYQLKEIRSGTLQTLPFFSGLN